MVTESNSQVQNADHMQSSIGLLYLTTLMCSLYYRNTKSMIDLNQ
uniref:Uncharacterized protein n=1 Tax=Arundo donax TaxID=35708 RepID=A0A0A9C1K7_ARUDO